MSRECKAAGMCLYFLGFLKLEAELSLMWSYLIEMFPKGEIRNRYLCPCMF